MPKKPKFKPVITRIKLNPEQAVLTCSCWTVGRVQAGLYTYYSDGPVVQYCSPGKEMPWTAEGCPGGSKYAGIPFNSDSASS